MNGKPKVYIDGREGTTGLQIFERLEKRTDLELLLISEEKRKDPEERKKYLNAADVAFLCLPDGAAREAVSMIENPATRVIDASTAHRTAKGWVYGFPELSGEQKEAVAAAARVANPGCHATGFISAVYPLRRLGIIRQDQALTCFSLTGYSGGGKKMIAEYEGEGRDKALDSPRIYGLNLNHKHIPEMKAVCGLTAAPVFSPIVADYYKGMATTVALPASAAGGLGAERIWKELTAWYEGCSLVQVAPLIPHAHKLNEEHKLKVNPADAIDILRSHNESQIAEFAERLAKLVQNDEQSVKDLVNSEGICDALFEALSEATSESLRQILIRALQALFPLLGDQQTVLIDNGLVSLCSDFLSLPTLSVVSDTADLIAVIARCSSWGRDTIVCCGIQDMLIDLALQSGNETVCVKACAALAHIFEECDNNMTDFALSTAQNAMNLLQIESIPAMRWILDLLSNLSKATATVSWLLDNSVHTLTVKFLQIEDLRRPALTLLSHLLTGESFKVREVVNAGILPLLFGLLGSEHTSQALIVLSTLAETIPDVFFTLVTPQMAIEIVEMAQVANFDIRRECVFFLATLLQFLPPDALPLLVTPQVMDELSEMCSCGNGKVVVRCLAGIIRVGMLSMSSGRAQEFKNVMLATEMVSRLEELGLCENKCVVKAALTLQSMLSE